MTMHFFDFSKEILAIFVTWCLYSTLYGKSNPFRSFAQASYIGFAMGLNVIVNIWFLFNYGFMPITRGDWILVIGIVLGILMLLRVNTKYAYISRVSLAVAVGTRLGMSLRTSIFTGVINQIQAMIVPLFMSGDLTQNLYNITTTLATLLMLTFFIYTVEVKGPLRTSSKLGEYALYISFGAIFAQTFMGRLGLFVGYLQNLTEPAWKIPYNLVFGVLILVAILVMDRYGVLEKYSD